jgi:hypothetical protein
MPKIISLIVLCAMIGSFGCKNYPCSDRLILATFVGFKESEIDTFIIRRYVQNSNFQTLIDTFLITNKELNGGYGDGIYTTSNDTTIVFVDDSYPNNGIFPGYDWKIYLPKINRTISIWHIIREEIEGHRGCENPNTFQVDSIFSSSPKYFDTQAFYTTGYRAYILR